MFAVMFVAMYFLMIRPQKKRQQEQQAMIAALGEGDRVMLTSGIFVTIKHLGDKQAIVELSPGNEVTILRQVILRAVAADEDEFEYTDETATNDVQPPADMDAAVAEEIFARPSEDAVATDSPKAEEPPTQQNRGSSAI